MLERFFLTILEIGIACSPVIILLLLAVPLLGKRYSPKLRHLLWLALAIRLILPINMPWQYALQINLFFTPESQLEQTDWFLPNPAQVLEHDSDAEAEDQGAMLETERGHNNYFSINPLPLLTTVWAAGMALFLIYHLGAYLHTLQRLHRWSTPDRDEDAHQMLASIKRELAIRLDVRLYRSSKAASPLLMGFVRPRIILPQEPISQERLEFMLRHELWHLKRGDLWCKLLMLLVNAIHWFNPLVWLMDRQANLDTELSCDADLLRNSGHDERKAYGYTVLSFIEQGMSCKTPLTTRFYGGKAQMKQRFLGIADTSVKKQGTVLLCITILIITLAGCAVHASEPSEPNIQAVTNTPELKLVDTPVQQSEVQNELEELYKHIDWTQDPYTGGEMAWPFPDNIRIIAPYGESPQIPDNFHTGLDIGGEHGAPIIAANDGVVKLVNTAYTNGVGYGMYIILDHGGETSTLYAHCSKILVSEGDSVAKGQKIAEAGATGWAFEPHLHFEVRIEGKHEDPMPHITSPGFLWPTNGGYVAEKMGGYPGHTGIDISGISMDSPVYAAAAGTVTVARDTNVGYGKYITVDHGNGYQTFYGHNSALYVNVGDEVALGQTIAAVGRSGRATDYMLHFEIRRNGESLDPEEFLVVLSGTIPRDDMVVQPSELANYIELEPDDPDNSHSYSERDPGNPGNVDIPVYDKQAGAEG